MQRNETRRRREAAVPRDLGPSGIDNQRVVVVPEISLPAVEILSAVNNNFLLLFTQSFALMYVCLMMTRGN